MHRSLCAMMFPVFTTACRQIRTGVGDEERQDWRPTEQRRQNYGYNSPHPIRVYRKHLSFSSQGRLPVVMKARCISAP
jgi:hypothetical protein